MSGLTVEQLADVLRHVDPLTLVHLWLELYGALDTEVAITQEPKLRTERLNVLRNVAAMVQAEVFSNMGQRWFWSNAVREAQNHYKLQDWQMQPLHEGLQQSPDDDQPPTL